MNKKETPTREPDTEVDRWLDEGGRDLRDGPENAAQASAGARAGAEVIAAEVRGERLDGYDPCLPWLPRGCEAQPAGGFHDRTGRFSYEFYRVYGPPVLLDTRGPTCQLDEGLSYWGMTWPAFARDADEHPAGRWVNFLQARRLLGPHLTFERFSSRERMREELPDLLHQRGVPPRHVPDLPL